LLGLCLCGPALADWRDEIGSFRVAVAATEDAEAAALRAEPFRMALEQALGLPVEIVPMRDFPAMIEAASRSRIEYAVYSASAHAAAFARCECVEPLVTATFADGSDHYRNILIVREDGPADLARLRGGKIAVIEGSAVSGRMLAAFELKKAGLDLAGGGATQVSYPDGAAALAAFADGAVDAMLGWASAPGDSSQEQPRGTLRQMAELQGEKAPGVRVLWQSSPVPHNVHAVRKNLAGEAKNILRSLLGNLFDSDPLAFDAVEPNFGGRFIAARQSQFDPLVAMFRETGLAGPAESR
jgi:phosphonate transport system substrate-binding protein